jgi:hypothetical protein
MNDGEEVRPGTTRSRQRRARLREQGIVILQLELEGTAASQLTQAAELANIPIGRLASVIIRRHFETRLGGRKRNAETE